MATSPRRITSISSFVANNARLVALGALTVTMVGAGALGISLSSPTPTQPAAAADPPRTNNAAGRDLDRAAATPTPSPVPSPVPSSAPPTAPPTTPPPTRKKPPTPTATAKKPSTSSSSSKSAKSSSTTTSTPAACQKYGGNQLTACKLLPSFGFGYDQMDSLVQLWTGESDWNEYAENPSSGAYGIPQSLPAEKLAEAGSDWRTNAATQIKWGLGYIRDVYGSPDNAWAFWNNQWPHWY